MKIYSLSFLALFSLLVLTDCKKDKPGCGCNSQTVSMFSNSRGFLKFDSVEHRYVIITPAAGGYQKNFICDSTVGKLFTIYTGGLPVLVTFSGDVTKFCTLDTVGYIDNPTYIKLISISQ